MKTDQFFQDDSDDPDESRPTKKNSSARVSQYFSHVKQNKTNLNRTEVVSDALKNEWWFDMFDVERSKFDVRRREKQNEFFQISN